MVEFETLLSNKNYEIKVKANFDLDDSQGFKSDVVLYSGLFSTIDNSIPNASIINPVVTSNSIVFDVVYTDEDGVTEPDGITVAVFKDGVLDISVPLVHLTGSTVGVTIGDLLNNNDYTLKVLSDYDLLDGHSTITDAVVATKTFSTLPRPLPVVNITNLSIEENRILFEFNIDDPDGLIDKDTLIAKLYVGEVTPQQEVAINEYSADFQIFNLFADDAFTIEIEASYDLNDGLGIQTEKIIFSQEFTTYENDTPVVLVDDIVITQGYVTTSLEVFDDDNTLKGALTAKLYEIYFDAGVEMEVEVGEIQFDVDASELVFSYLTSYLRGYRVDILADYDLRDGSVPRENENIFRSVLLASERKAPSAELNNIIFGTEQIEVNVNLMDSDNTIEAGTSYVYLYYNGVIVGTETLVTGQNDILFDDLYSNNEYEIVVETNYNYDLIEETVLLLNQSLVSSVVYTIEKEIPAATIDATDIISRDGEIEFKVAIIDEFDTIDIATLFALLYLDDVDTTLSQPLVVGNNFGVTFTGLLSDTQYEIRIVTEYDLNDGNGTSDLTVLTDALATTKTKETPSSQNLNITATQDEITFDVEIVDPDGVISGIPVAKLFIGATDTGEEVDLIVGINSSVKFTPVLSGERYNIRIVADYDYNDGTLESIQLGASIVSGYVNTLTNAMITAEIADLVTDKTSITFDVEVLDENDVLENGLQAVLYDEFGVAAVGIPAEPVSVGDNPNVTFTGLFSDYNYIVKIEANYDLNEGAGIEADVLDDTEAVTLPLEGPSATITIDNAETLNTRIEFDVSVIDTDGTVTVGTLQAFLFDMDGVQVGLPIDLIVGSNNNLFFDDLMFGTEYEIKVFTDYNLNSDEVDIEDVLLVSGNETTVSLITIIDIIEDKKLINFTLDVTDIFSVLVPVGEVTGVEVTLFDENDLQVGDVYFVSEPTDFDLLNLWSDYDYKLIVKGNYDVGSGAGIDTVFEYEFHTLPVEVADMMVINLDPTNATDIVFEVTGVEDVDGIISGFVDDGFTPGSLEAVLYVDGVAELTTLPIAADGTYTFSGYDGTDGKDYAIVIRADVDLNDSEGLITDFEFYVKSWIWADKN